MKIHELKTWPQFFDLMMRGLKDFDHRRNDRSFAAGELVRLREWDPKKEGFTGRWLLRMITYVCSEAPGLADGYVIMQTIPAQATLVPKRITAGWW